MWYLEVSGAGEILSILVERDGHDSIRGIEGLLYPIAMMYINVYIQHTLVVPRHTLS